MLQNMIAFILLQPPLDFPIFIQLFLLLKIILKYSLIILDAHRLCVASMQFFCCQSLVLQDDSWALLKVLYLNFFLVENFHHTKMMELHQFPNNKCSDSWIILNESHSNHMRLYKLSWLTNGVSPLFKSFQERLIIDLNQFY